MKKKIICWWSGGVTSAVACNIAIELYGIRNVRVLFIDTHNEDLDTYRFKNDCKKWYGVKIETISAIPDKYKCIQDVWIKFGGLNFANGAICSSELKREVRIKWQKDNEYEHQVFGFDMSEPKRARGLTINYPDARAIYPLLFKGLFKECCVHILEDAGISIPLAYKFGFQNNNCLDTGCVRGGIGYWQHMFRIKPDVYDAMGEMEHYLTWLKGAPVYICKIQSKEAKKLGNTHTMLFLKKNKNYPEIKTVLEVKGRPPKPLVDCNGFCGVNDLSRRISTEKEIGYQIELPYDA